MDPGERWISSAQRLVTGHPKIPRRKTNTRVQTVVFGDPVTRDTSIVVSRLRSSTRTQGHEETRSQRR